MKKIIFTVILLVSAVSYLTAAQMKKLEGSEKEKIKFLYKEMYYSLDRDNEQRAAVLRKLINELKDGKEVTDYPARKQVEKGPSEEDLEALESREVRKIEREINRRDGEELREKLNKEQENEYNARRLFLDGKKGLVKNDYKYARNALTEAHKLKPDDEDIEHYYHLAHFPEFTVTSEKNIISLKKDKQVNINISHEKHENGYEAKKWCTSWKLNIIRKRREKIIKTFKGKEVPPENIVWDGKDEKGRLSRDGIYFADLIIKGKYYTKTKAKRYTFELQAKPPSVQLQVDKEAFVAQDENVEIKISCENPEEIAEWKIIIINQVGELIYKIEGKEIKESIIWDGKNMKGQYVGEGETLTVKMSGKDTLGKKWDSNEDTIISDIRIVDNKISLNNIRFETAKAKLKKVSLPILDKVVDLLSRYPYFDIKVVGHTDSVGNESYNLGLSKRRAKSVMNYLVKQGVAQSRLTSEGKGESEPIASNDTEEGRAQNRRVEFLLKENKEKKKAYYERKRQEMIEKAKE
ncbi:MAG TPA: OmpA family protein [Spirochaetota bacterium]|nr:OmpA family protein [Spirochaetota bacterium]